jgi:hypothetical protein
MKAGRRRTTEDSTFRRTPSPFARAQGMVWALTSHLDGMFEWPRCYHGCFEIPFLKAGTQVIRQFSDLRFPRVSWYPHQ